MWFLRGFVPPYPGDHCLTAGLFGLLNEFELESPPEVVERVREEEESDEPPEVTEVIPVAAKMGEYIHHFIIQRFDYFFHYFKMI